MNGDASAEKKNPDIGADALSGAVSKLLEHPELISMVASALGQSSHEAPKGSPPPESSPVPAKEEQTDVMASVLPILSKLSSSDGAHSSFKHAGLLCALKPYVSKSRADAIDYIIRISQISGLIGKIK